MGFHVGVLSYNHRKLPGASFSKNLKSSSDLKLGKDNGYHGD